MIFATIRGKGGEHMSLEAIKKVAESEQNSAQRKAEAAQQAKKLVADASREGEALLASARQKAEAQVKIFMTEAEEKAAKHTAEVMKDTQRACEELKQAASARLDEAAALIVRRVVND